MKRVFLSVLMVLVLCWVMISCSKTYTSVRPVESTPSTYASDRDSCKGSEYEYTFTIPKDSVESKVERSGTTAVLKSVEGQMATAVFSLPATRTYQWRVGIDADGGGEMLVAFSDGSSERNEDKRIPGESLDLSRRGGSGELLLEDVGRFINPEGRVEIHITASGGEDITVKSIFIRYLRPEEQQKVRVIYRDYFPSSYSYSTWHYYYDGPYCTEYYYYDGWLYKVVYGKWSCSPFYWSWRTRVEYYYPYTPCYDVCRYIEVCRAQHKHRGPDSWARHSVGRERDKYPSTDRAPQRNNPGSDSRRAPQDPDSREADKRSRQITDMKTRREDPRLQQLELEKAAAQVIQERRAAKEEVGRESKEAQGAPARETGSTSSNRKVRREDDVRLRVRSTAGSSSQGRSGSSNVGSDHSTRTGATPTKVRREETRGNTQTRSSTPSRQVQQAPPKKEDDDKDSEQHASSSRKGRVEDSSDRNGQGSRSATAGSSEKKRRGR